MAMQTKITNSRVKTIEIMVLKCSLEYIAIICLFNLALLGDVRWFVGKDY